VGKNVMKMGGEEGADGRGAVGVRIIRDEKLQGEASRLPRDVKLSSFGTPFFSNEDMRELAGWMANLLAGSAVLAGAEVDGHKIWFWHTRS